jgi:ribosomal protein S18 acetylase RimI-like enzyme
MSVLKLEYADLRDKSKELLISTIYNNFKDLSSNPKLMHTPENIRKIVNSKNAVILLYMDQNKICGYLIAEEMKLLDRRQVMYISYIYVAPSYRNKRVGCKLMNYITAVTETKHLDGIMLIYDTRKAHLRNFYDKQGFMIDFGLRRYEDNEVFYKVL